MIIKLSPRFFLVFIGSLMYLLSESAKVPFVKMNTATRIWCQKPLCVKPLYPGQRGAVGHVELGQLRWSCIISFGEYWRHKRGCYWLWMNSYEHCIISYLLLLFSGQELTDSGAVPRWQDEGRLAVTPEADPGHRGLMGPPGEHHLTGDTPQTHLAVIMTQNNTYQKWEWTFDQTVSSTSVKPTVNRDFRI